MYDLMPDDNPVTQLKNRVSGALKRVGVHILAITVSIAAFKLAQAPFVYVGLICLAHRGFSLRANATIFPFVTALGQLALCMLGGIIPLHLAIFLAGVQSWLQRGIVRKFKIGLDWVMAPALLAGFFANVQEYSYPWGLMALTLLCGLGGAFIAQSLDARARIPALAKAFVPLADAALALPLLPKELAGSLEKTRAHCLAFSGGFPHGGITQAMVLQRCLRHAGAKLEQLPRLAEAQSARQGRAGARPPARQNGLAGGFGGA